MSVPTIDKLMSKIETEDGETCSIYQKQYNSSLNIPYTKFILDVDAYSKIEHSDYLFDNTTNSKPIAHNKEADVYVVYCGRNSGIVPQIMSPPIYIDTEFFPVGKTIMADGTEYIIKEPFRKYQTAKNIYGFGLGSNVYSDSSNLLHIDVYDFRTPQYCWINETYFNEWYI